MPAQWTGDVIGKMHLFKITAKDLAAEIGWHPKYLSAVLNGKKEPKAGEEKIRDALMRLIEAKEEE